MQKKGFTLIELLIVIAIIGILAVVSVPVYTGQQKKAARTEAYTNLQNLRLLEEQYFAENGSYWGTVSTLPGWKPGPDLNFDYTVTNVAGKGLPTPVPQPYDDSTANLSPATTPCFIGKAKGRAGTRVANDCFTIDCNNNRNF